MLACRDGAGPAAPKVIRHSQPAGGLVQTLLILKKTDPNGDVKIGPDRAGESKLSWLTFPGRKNF